MLDEPQGLLSRDDPVVRLVDEVGQHQDGNVRRHLVVIRGFNNLWLRTKRDSIIRVYSHALEV